MKRTHRKFTQIIQGRHLPSKICALLVFFILTACSLRFLHSFMTTTNSMVYLSWENAEQINGDGSVIPYDLTTMEMPTDSSSDTVYRFRTTLPDYMEDGFLMFEVANMETVLYLNQTELYRSSCVQPEGTLNMAQSTLPLSSDCAGQQLTMEVKLVASGNFLFPPLIRYTSNFLQEKDTVAYANFYGIPAGISAFSYLFICGIFLIGIFHGKPDWSLLMLSVAAGGITVYELAVGYGYMFMSERLFAVCSWGGIPYLVLLCLLGYLLLNWKRKFLRYFGIVFGWSTAFLLVLYFISLSRHGKLSSYVASAITSFFTFGYLEGPVYWLIIWMVILCAAVAGYKLIASILNTQDRMHAYAQHSRLAMDSYHAIEQKMQETASLRHEWRHQLASLSYLYQQGNFSELGANLESLQQAQLRLAQTKYTDHFVINALLQNAENTAHEKNIRFEAKVMVPPTLSVTDADLCSLLTNLLDNAIEACEKITDVSQRFISFHAKVKQNFLVIHCENSYTGALNVDKKGKLLTTKTDCTFHGFGLHQMNSIAEKYHSMLDISYTENIFTAQTALKLPGQ